jgi:alpha-L-fucosidase
MSSSIIPSRRKTPQWFQDAKLGIFVHWGPYAVPAWAPRAGHLDQVLLEAGWRGWFAANPHAEWYRNSILVEGSPSRKHHDQKYGKAHPYELFGPEFLKASRKWDAAKWMNLFRAAGARYLVFTAKQHDGFLMWDSQHPDPHAPGYQVRWDMLGKLAAEARASKIKFGLYFSGGLDWAYQPDVIRDYADMFTAIPDGQEYADLVMAHYRELIGRYKPAILWNDIGFPTEADLAGLVKEYYETVEDGVINDRFCQFDMGAAGSLKRKLMQTAMARVGRSLAKDPQQRGGGRMAVPCDFHTMESWQFREPVRQKWEAVIALGWSFGYNREEKDTDLMSVADLVHTLVDVVSKNGNLLINVGAKADGSIPVAQERRLRGLGKWLAVNGEAIYGSRPCIRAEGRTVDGMPVRFTRKGYALYAILLGAAQGRTIEIENMQLRPAARVTLAGSRKKIKWQPHGRNVKFELPSNIEGTPAVAVRIQLVPEMPQENVMEGKE